LYIPFRFATLSLDDAVDGLENEQSTENGQSPDVVSAGDARGAPDGEDGVQQKEETSEDGLCGSQHSAETDSLHRMAASRHETTAHTINSHRSETEAGRLTLS